ncbi:MAG: glutamate formimidoyltransferase [Acidobacteria bacterium]|nr:MAG: glutamate formimidoyltransferase [Acidobacteriota bacterium]
MQTIVECVPNFSEGEDRNKIKSILQALVASPDVHLLDTQMDADHNRTVVTFVGSRESVGEAALRSIGRAAELIDLNEHHGVHPRMGATDVVPFVPIKGVDLHDCIEIARWVAQETWRRFRIPAYLYEAAARDLRRKNLEYIRRGQFEQLREEVRENPDRRPDFGEADLHPTAGATAVGARNFLIAYNINLKTADLNLAKFIARKIRTSDGGLAAVKAIGVEAKTLGVVQVSINLTDFLVTSIGTVFDAVAAEAKRTDVAIESSEIVGLVPRQAIETTDIPRLKLQNFSPQLILENRLAEVRGNVL